jgi:hypothetical protein
MDQQNQHPLPRVFVSILPKEDVLQVQDHFARLYERCEIPSNRTLYMHLRDYILPGLAYYQVLKESGLSQEQAIERIDHLFDWFGARGQKRFRLLGRLPFIYALLRLIIKPFMRQYPEPGWELEWVENSPNAIRFNMKKCYYFKTLTDLGAPELTASFCRVDDLIYEHLSPRMIWQRTETIGRGDALCNFCFINAKVKE